MVFELLVDLQLSHLFMVRLVITTDVIVYKLIEVVARLQVAAGDFHIAHLVQLVLVDHTTRHVVHAGLSV